MGEFCCWGYSEEGRPCLLEIREFEWERGGLDVYYLDSDGAAV